MLFMALTVQISFAQNTKEVSGRVSDANGVPLPGVNISVQGTSSGTTTDFDGDYTIRVEEGQVLVFSSVGFEDQTKSVGDSNTINVTMQEGTELEEVVVTAYGIKKERKALGYAYENVSGEQVVEARTTNVTDALAGKVSGLNLSKSHNGPAGSSKIILRGFNSLTGDNQPLIVVDGMPMSNFVGQDNPDYWNPSLDMGNGLSDLNPEDIADITVLKGGAASALYGSRAGNGVIEITTKQGRETQGAGITYSNTLNLVTMMDHPRLQNNFSQGTSGIFAKESEQSWGEEITGQSVEYWDGSNRNLQTYDNIGNFFSTGIAENNTLTLQKMVGENTGVFTSVSHLTDKGMSPNMQLDRLNATTRVTTTYGKENRWSTDVKVQYINSIARNRPFGGYDQSYYSNVLLLPTTLDITEFRNGMDELGVDSRSNWYDPNERSNPYWAVYNNLNKDVRNRFMLNGDIGYEFTDWLNVHAKVGSDMYNTKTERKVYTGGPLNNQYHTGMDRYSETNFIGSINMHKDNFAGNWSGSLSMFGQIMKRKNNSLDIGIEDMDIDNYFTVGNHAEGKPNVQEGISKQQINSAFATIDLSYDDFWFINATARNDWSSTMSKENRSYFYPSVSTSLVVTDMFRKVWGSKPFGDVINFAKLRGSYAETGNALAPYQLDNIYTVGHDPLGNLNASAGNTLYNRDVRSELLTTYELGVNLRFFNAFDLDVNYYDTHAKRQLISLPMNPLSGYESRMINAGDIQNQGVEVTLNADVINRDDFKWNVNANFSKNKNKIIELTEGVNTYALGGFADVNILAEVGHRYGVIRGTRYTRVEDESSEFYGKKILNGDGLPTTDGERYTLGDQTPRANVGITNNFTYKNFNFSFQVDGRFGGKFFSGTMNELKHKGLAAETVVDGKREKFVVDGVIKDDDGNYTQSNIEVTPQDYWRTVAGAGNLGISEENLFDATNVRLRNVQLTYNFPKTLLESSPLTNAKLSFSVNNAWMIYSKVKGLDPEATYATSTNAHGFEMLSFPTSREFVFNLTIGF